RSERPHVDNAADTGAARLGDDMGDTGHVDVGEPLLALRRNRHRMDHRVETVKHTAERLRFAHVATAHVDLSTCAGQLLFRTGTLADDRTHLVPAEEQPGDRVPPHESVPAGRSEEHTSE